MTVAHKPSHFRLVLGFPSFKAHILFSKSRRNQWDSSPIHSKHSNTNAMLIHACKLAIMEKCPYMPHLAQMMWNIICLPWWALMFITSKCLYHKSLQVDKLWMIWLNGSKLWKQRCCQSCLIGDQVVSLLMMPLKNCGHYSEYESYLTFLFIIMFNEGQQLSLSKVFFIPTTKITMYLSI